MEPFKPPTTVSFESGNQERSCNHSERSLRIRSISRNKDGPSFTSPVFSNTKSTSQERGFKKTDESPLFLMNKADNLDKQQSFTTQRPEKDQTISAESLPLQEPPNQPVNFFQKFRIKKTSAPNSPNLSGTIRERYCMFGNTISKSTGSPVESELGSTRLKPNHGKASSASTAQTTKNTFAPQILPSSQIIPPLLQVTYNSAVKIQSAPLQLAKYSQMPGASANFTNQSTEASQNNNRYRISSLEQVLNRPEWQNLSITLDELFALEHTRDSRKRLSSEAIKPCLKKISACRANISSVDKKVRINMPQLSPVFQKGGQDQSSKLVTFPRRTRSTPRACVATEQSSSDSLDQITAEDSNKKKTVRFTRHALVLQF